MKKQLEIANKQIKSFFYDLTKDKTDKIDVEVNKFLRNKDGEDVDIFPFFAEPYLSITIVYLTDD